jgi:hypothetical protein
MDTMILLELIAGLTAYAIGATAERYIRSYDNATWSELNEED